MPDTGLQLLPQTRKRIEVSIPGENRTLYFGIVILLLSIAIVGGLRFYETNRNNALTALNNQIAGLENQRDKKTESNIVSLNKKTSTISKLLASHIYWSKGLERFGGMLNTQVQLDSLSLSTVENKISFQAQAPNYSTIARQVAAFVANDAIKDVTLGEIKTLTAGKLQFSVVLSIDVPKLLKNE